MKRFLSIATIMAMALLMFTSCSNNDEPKDNDKPYIGTYYGTENLSDSHNEGVIEQYQYTLVLRPDNTFSIIDDDVYYEETYHYDGTYIYLEKENILYLTPITETYYNWGEYEYSRPYTDDTFYLKSNNNWKNLLVSYDNEDWEETPLIKISNKY